jgi:hypothetical protein
MGLCTPMSLIYEWLDRDDLGFVLDPQASSEVAADVLPDVAAPPR